MQLRDYIDDYCLCRNVSEKYKEQLIVAVSHVGRWAGYRVSFDDLNDEFVNRYLLYFESYGAPATVRSRRAAIISLWRAGFEEELCVAQPRRIRKAPKDCRIIRAITHEEIARLIGSARLVTGSFKLTKIRRAAYWESFIRTAYDTALRLSDIQSIERGWIRSGVIAIVQSKTRKPHRVQLSETTIRAIDKSMQNSQRRLIWPLWGRREAFFRAFKKLAKAAGVDCTTKYLRRASASYYERDNPGQAWRHLGHTGPGLDRTAYIDESIAYKDRPLPPALEC